MAHIRGRSTEDSLENETSSDDSDDISLVNKRRTPLPWSQLSIIYLVDMTESIATSLIYPFVTQLVRETGITEGDDRKTGYFTGIILSALSFAEAFAVVPIGMAADRYGRRAFLLLGPLGLVPLMLAFGMTTQYWPLVAMRAVQGMVNANIAVAKTVVGEITDSSNNSDAFPYLALSWLAGSTIGPLIGGLLSHPATQYSYLLVHPYFLPCLVTSLWSITIFVFAAMTLRETLPSALSRSKQRHSSWPCAADDPDYDADSSPLLEGGLVLSRDEPRLPGLRDILKLPDYGIILINVAFYYLCNSSLASLIVLMWSTSIELGGLGWSTSRIGIIMGLRGAVDALLQITILGKLIRKFGSRKVFILAISSFLVTFLSFPLANLTARQAGGSDWKVFLVVFISLLSQSLRHGAYATSMLFVKASAPSQPSLATMNGLAQAVGEIMGCIGPSFASSLFSLSLQHQLANGYAVYYILVVIVACGIRFSLMLPKHGCLKQPISPSP